MSDHNDLDDEYEKSQRDNKSEGDDWGDDEEDEVSDNLEDVSFVCEDCDYRWEETGTEEVDETNVVCPMCGSTNVTLL